MAASITSSIIAKNFHLRIYLHPRELLYYPFPEDPYFRFTWKQRVVPHLLRSTEDTSTKTQLVRLCRPDCWLVLLVDREWGNPCIYEDIIEVPVPTKEGRYFHNLSFTARRQGIDRFWEDFFSRIYHITHEKILEELVHQQHCRFISSGLPLGLYAKVEEIKTFFNPLTGLKL